MAWFFRVAAPCPRHPSQLYEAFLEGLLLFLVLLWFARRRENFERTGFLGGVFLAGYGIARPVAELFREPDAHIGFLTVGTTMGQWLSLPLLGLALALLVLHRRRPLPGGGHERASSSDEPPRFLLL